MLEYSQTVFVYLVSALHSIHVFCQTGLPRGGGNRRYFPGEPQIFKGAHGAFIFMGWIFTLFLYLSLPLHVLHSMSERFARIISNAFTVSVDKLFDARRTNTVN